MRLDRHMAFWLAAIVLIALFGMPSSASAHSASGHPGHGHSGLTETRHASVSAQHVTAPVIVMEAQVRGAGLGCVGLCCAAGCGVGGHCCTSGLAPETETIPFAERAGGPAPAHDLPAMTGIVPEGLAEPPRTIA